MSQTCIRHCIESCFIKSNIHHTTLHEHSLHHSLHLYRQNRVHNHINGFHTIWKPHSRRSNREWKWRYLRYRWHCNRHSKMFLHRFYLEFLKQIHIQLKWLFSQDCIHLEVREHSLFKSKSVRFNRFRLQLQLDYRKILAYVYGINRILHRKTILTLSIRHKKIQIHRIQQRLQGERTSLC